LFIQSREKKNNKNLLCIFLEKVYIEENEKKNQLAKNNTYKLEALSGRIH